MLGRRACMTKAAMSSSAPPARHPITTGSASQALRTRAGLHGEAVQEGGETGRREQGHTDHVGNGWLLHPVRPPKGSHLSDERGSADTPMGTYGTEEDPAPS